MTKKLFTKKAMAMGMAAVMAVTSVVVVDTTASAATYKNLKKATTAKTLVVAKGKKQTIKVTKVPKKAKIKFVSKKKKIATVTKKGVVKGKKAGKTTILVKLSYKGKKKTLKVKTTVSKAAVKKITLNKKKATIAVGKTVTIKAKTITPKTASKKVTFSTNKKKVATVTAKGVVKGIAAGTAKITVKAADGSNKKAVCTVTVTAPTVQPTATVSAGAVATTPGVKATATATAPANNGATPSANPNGGNTATTTPSVNPTDGNGGTTPGAATATPGAATATPVAPTEDPTQLTGKVELTKTATKTYTYAENAKDVTLLVMYTDGSKATYTLSGAAIDAYAAKAATLGAITYVKTATTGAVTTATVTTADAIDGNTFAIDGLTVTVTGFNRANKKATVKVTATAEDVDYLLFVEQMEEKKYEKADLATGVAITVKTEDGEDVELTLTKEALKTIKNATGTAVVSCGGSNVEVKKNGNVATATAYGVVITAVANEETEELQVSVVTADGKNVSFELK